MQILGATPVRNEMKNFKWLTERNKLRPTFYRKIFTVKYLRGLAGSVHLLSDEIPCTLEKKRNHFL